MCLCSATDSKYQPVCSMENIRQIALQLPHGLQRLQLNFLANGLIGWSADSSQDPNEEEYAEDVSPVHPNEGSFAQPRRRGRSQTSRSSYHSQSLHGHQDDHDDDDGDDADNAGDDINDDADDVVEAHSDTEPEDDVNTQTAQDARPMTDEQQIEAIRAFIVGSDTSNATLRQAAILAATQLVEALSDDSNYIHPEVIDLLLDVDVHLDPVDGGLQLRIGHGIMARCIYIYGSDDEEDGEDSDSYNSADEASERSYHDSDGGSQDEQYTDLTQDAPQAVMTADATATSEGIPEQGAVCPVCFSAYSGNLRMAALGCHHHMCNGCFRRLPRPKLCPICRTRVSSHVEVIM